MEDREATATASHASSHASQRCLTLVSRYSSVRRCPWWSWWRYAWPELEWPRRMSFLELAFSRIVLMSLRECSLPHSAGVKPTSPSRETRTAGERARGS